MRKYFRHKKSKAEFAFYKRIGNGVIITKFDEKTGSPISNDYYQQYVTAEELNSDYEEFRFKMATNDTMDNILAKYLPEIVSQMDNYGIQEVQARNLKEFYHHSPESLDLYRRAVKDDKVELKDFFGACDDDDYYWSEAEELFPFIHLGLLPILKKMMIELTNE